MSVQASTYIKSAIALAKMASRASIRPNPFVGAVLINQNDEIVGKGFHKKYGQAHAEVVAIQDALQNGADLRTCTLVVTLEPCSHTGKTPPCTDLIRSSGIPRVIVGSKDPNPLVHGMDLLTAAGIEVHLEESAEAIEMNAEFFVNQRFKRPFVRVKAAMTSDGFMARENGDSKWISSEESRAWAHAHCRSNVDAILTTAKTVLADNAKLNVRRDGKEYEQTAIVIDRDCSLLKQNDLAVHYPREDTQLYLVTDEPEAIVTEVDWHRIDGVFETGRVDIGKLLSDLYEKNGVYSLLVEAGPRFINGLLHVGIVDELIVFESPVCFNNPTDRYRLDLSPAAAMHATEVKIDGPDRVMKYTRSLQ